MGCCEYATMLLQFILLRLSPDNSVKSFLRTQHSVFNIAQDKFIKGNLLFADRHALKSTDGSSTSTIAGSALSYGYVEGIGTTSRFNNIKDFIQLTDSTVLVIDLGNHCLRIINRFNNETAAYLGSCEHRGYTNGADPQFNLPYSVIFDL